MWDKFGTYDIKIGENLWDIDIKIFTVSHIKKIACTEPTDLGLSVAVDSLPLRPLFFNPLGPALWDLGETVNCFGHKRWCGYVRLRPQIGGKRNEWAR